MKKIKHRVVKIALMLLACLVIGYSIHCGVHLWKLRH